MHVKLICSVFVLFVGSFLLITRCPITNVRVKVMSSYALVPVFGLTDVSHCLFELYGCLSLHQKPQICF